MSTNVILIVGLAVGLAVLVFLGYYFIRRT